MPYHKNFLEKHPLLSILIVAAIVTGILVIPRAWNPNWLSYSYENKQLAKESFQEINQFRKQNNLSALAEESKSYDLAVYLSKGKFFDREYLTEDQKAALIKRSKLSKNSKFFLGVLDEAESENMRLLTQRWTSLVTSKEAILNSEYTTGSVSCYGRYCSLVLTG
jgi:hypothetical protein